MKLVWIILIVCGAWLAFAAEVALEWDASPSPNISGYTIHYGPGSRDYTTAVALPANARTATITNLGFGTWFFAATARNTAGLESDPSNEVSDVNRFAGLNLRITRAVGDSTTIEGSADGVSWQPLAIVPQEGPPVTLASRPRQMFRASGTPPLPGADFTAASASGPILSAPTTHTQARERAQKKKVKR